MLTTGLTQFLLQQTAITAIVAGGNSIQPIPAPTDPDLFPCVTYQQVSETNEYTLTGTAGMTHARIVFNALAPQNPGGYLIARTLALAVKAALDGFSGVLPDGTKVWFLEVVNCLDLFDADATLSQTSVHCMITFES
jgi:hypothetical protein